MVGQFLVSGAEELEGVRFHPNSGALVRNTGWRCFPAIEIDRQLYAAAFQMIDRRNCVL
jgi:hypothetical protein